MGREMTVALAQTGPVPGADPSDGAAEACRLIERAADAGADLICFGELFLAPFFPNRLEEDFDRYFLHLPDPRVFKPRPRLARSYFPPGRYQGGARRLRHGDGLSHGNGLRPLLHRRRNPDRPLG